MHLPFFEGEVGTVGQMSGKGGRLFRRVAVCFVRSVWSREGRC